MKGIHKLLQIVGYMQKTVSKYKTGTLFRTGVDKLFKLKITDNTGFYLNPNTKASVYLWTSTSFYWFWNSETEYIREGKIE